MNRFEYIAAVLGTATMLLVLGLSVLLVLSSCTPVSHKPSRFKYGEPYRKGPDHVQQQ